MTKIPQIGQNLEDAVSDQRIGTEAESLTEFWLKFQFTHGFKMRLLN